MTYTFEFETPASHDSSKSLNNILHIAQEDENKHFIQYIQYKELQKENNIDSIEMSYINVKVDRSYFLEVANVCLSDRERRRQLFSTLGKRRFGANNKRYDYYLVNKDIDEKLLENAYAAYNRENPFILCYSETTDYSTNQYRVHLQEIEGSHFAYLDQINITKRKKLQKNFCVELINDEIEILKSTKNRKHRVNYIFNKIGKIYFKSLPKETLKLTSEHKDIQSLALSRLIKNSADMELSSRINDNLVFRKLKEKRELMDRVDLSLQKRCFEFLNSPYNEQNQSLFLSTLNDFITHTQELSQLDEISTHLTTMRTLVETKTLNYILDKQDNDLKDILLYAMEIFTHWNGYLYDEDEDIKGFNVATVDLIASLRHLIDMCYKFKHEYKCLDAEREKLEASNLAITSVAEITKENVTSAQEFFEDIHLDSEVYDELKELESEVEDLFYINTYTVEINDALIHFFEGYTHALNPLFEFKDLSYSFMLLAQKLSEYELKDNEEFLIALMRGLITDLLEWKKTVLVDQTAENIHYMDKSFYSNIAQIEMSLEDLDISENDDLIEFF